MFLGSPEIISSSLDHTQVVCLLSVKIDYSRIRHFQIAYNSPSPPASPKKKCINIVFSFCEVRLYVTPLKKWKQWLCKIGLRWGEGGRDNKVYYGQCENSEFPGPHKPVNFDHYKGVQLRANGRNNSQQCWGLQCFAGRI